MGLMDNPPPFKFGPGNLYIETGNTLASDQAERVEALKQALAVLGDRTTEEVLRAAHWIAEGEIIPTEGEDEDEDDN